MKRFAKLRTLAVGLGCLIALPLMAANPQKTIVLLAGKPSHGPGQHEHNAGIQLFAKKLKEAKVEADIKVYLNGEWPAQEVLDKANSLVIYADGGGGHPALQENRLEQIGKMMDRGSGFVCIHYGVEPTLEKGNREFIEWLGGCFETHWSVNPHWDANFEKLPNHPVARGVKPFGSNDEWYFHMRFRKGMKGVTPVLQDVPPDSTMERKDGPHQGNPHVRAAVAKKEPQIVSWAAENENGSRGFGFTGGHFHKGWGIDSQRTLILNAIVWSAGLEVPEQGIESTVTEAELLENLDLKPGQGLPAKK